MGLRRDLELIIAAKESKFGELNCAVNENSDVWYIRDNELIDIALLLSGEPFAGLFYNIDSEKYMLWNFAENAFKEFVFENYAAIYQSEDFEGGALPAGWTLVNGGENDWHVGTDTASSGTYSLYISNNGGTTNQYSSVGGGLDVSHAYFDVLLPNATGAMALIFDYRCEAEIGFDYGNVFNAPTSVTPVANTEVSGTYLVGSAEYNDQSSWVTESIDIPLAQANTTRRFIFSWRNDTTIENQPPFAIDNVKIAFQ